MAIAAVLLVAFASGCGGGGGSSSGATEDTVATNGLSKSQYLKKADEVCVRIRTRTTFRFQAAENRAAKEGQNPEKRFATAVAEAVVPGIEEKIKELRKLGAPKGGEAQVEAFIDAQQTAVDQLKNGSITTYGDLEKPLEPAEKLGSAYGYETC